MSKSYILKVLYLAVPGRAILTDKGHSVYSKYTALIWLYFKTAEKTRQFCEFWKSP